MKTQKIGKPLCRLIMAVVMMMLSLQAMAYDFSYTHQGKTLYYNITSDSTVAVTYYSSSSSSDNYVSGDVVIPSTVTYNDTTYSVTSIGDYAFYVSSLTSVTIGNSVTSIGWGAFQFCSGLTSVTIGNNVTTIGEWAFYNCYRLTSIIIPNSVITIGNLAFSGCSLYSITIGNNVTTIGNSAFSGFNYFDSISVKCLSAIPPSLDSICFNYSSSSLIYTLSVPCGSLNAYEESDWNIVFAGRISEELPFELNASANDSTLGTVVISTGESCAEGVLTAIPELCYRFVAWSDGNTTNPRTITLTQDTTLTANFERAVYTQEIHHAICEGSSYVDENFNVSEAGMYSHILQTADGCDSIITLNLTINPVFHDTITASICDGTIYAENGFIANEAGTYTQNLRTINGCDSIVTLNLMVNSLADTTITVSICEGTNYTENGFDVSEVGVHTLNLQTVNGCDSIVTLNLIVKPVYNCTIMASIREGETYNMNGFNESEAGTYTNTLQAENGCDSVITLDLTVIMSLDDVAEEAFALYPNPAKNFVILDFEALKTNIELQIFDIRGIIVKTENVKAGEKQIRIDLSNLSKGIYLIKFGNTTKKIVVE